MKKKQNIRQDKMWENKDFKKVWLVVKTRDRLQGSRKSFKKQVEGRFRRGERLHVEETEVKPFQAPEATL